MVGTAKIHNDSLPPGPLVSTSFSYLHLPHSKRDTLFTQIATRVNFDRIMLYEKEPISKIKYCMVPLYNTVEMRKG